MKNYVAVDIGASSGRVLLGNIENDKLKLQEIHRFDNNIKKEGIYEVWPTDFLLTEILTGLEKLKKLGVEKCSLGIDTWGVDYALLDKFGQKISEITSYRDSRTKYGMEDIAKIITKEDIYLKTGIQFQPFNTLFQLFVEEKEKLKMTETILLVPDYLNYRLTGKKTLERTNASTMQLLNLKTNDLDEELLSILGLDRNKFPPLIEAGEVIGELQHEKFPSFDLPEVQVISVGSHDTASAVVGTPGQGDDWAFLSSGTWSLLGVELIEPIVNQQAYDANFTNEEGVNHTYRFLKNIIGMWMIQEVSRNYNYEYSPKELADLARPVEAFKYYVDVNDPRFLNPENMIEEIQSYIQDKGKEIPKSPGEIARTIYDSLALCYQEELEKLSKLTKRDLKTLIIVGGGGNVHLLNQTIANLTGMTVYTGITEATAIGNMVIQMIANDEIKSIKEARELIKVSFPMETIYPKDKVE